MCMCLIYMQIYDYILYINICICIHIHAYILYMHIYIYDSLLYMYVCMHDFQNLSTKDKRNVPFVLCIHVSEEETNHEKTVKSEKQTEGFGREGW